jgi:putative alpha-1,2-mannosidase
LTPSIPSAETTYSALLLFDQATVDLGDGKQLKIDVTRSDPSQAYIQSFSLNGKRQSRAWFNHRDIAQGGTLHIRMGPTPNQAFATGLEDAPPSASLA